jgi:hypothetical protein
MKPMVPMTRFKTTLRSNALSIPVGVFLVYCLLTLTLTWPVAARMGTHLIGTGDDMWVHYWNNWWTKRVLQQGGPIFHTPLLFHPSGVSLLHHNFAWGNIAVWLLLEPFIGGIAAYNLVHLIHIPLCGLGMFLLARRLFRSDGIAFVSGLVFAFWPYRMLDVNHPNLISTELFPLFMLALLRLFQDGRQIRDGAIAGVLLALIGYMRWQLVVLAGLMAFLYVPYTLMWERSRWSWRTVAGLAVAAGVSIALVAPAVYPLVAADLAGGFSGETYAMELGSTTQDLLSWLVPQHQHPLSGLFDRAFPEYASLPGRGRFTAFLGFVVTGLAIVGTGKRWKEARFWFGLAVVCFSCALGPHLQFNGIHYVNVSLPIRLVDWALPIRMLRYPHRFTVLLAVPMAVLAGYGALVLKEWFGRRRWSRQIARPVVLSTVLGLLILVDYVSIPTATVSASVPDFCASLADESGEFAVVELPGKRRDAEYYMYYQTCHGRPIQTGHVSRLPSGALDYIASLPLLTTTYEEGGLNTQPPDVSRQLSALVEAGFRYIIIHKDRIASDQLAEWRSYLVISPHFEDEEVAVYSTAPVLGQAYSLAYDLEVGLGIVEARLSSGDIRPGTVLEAEIVWGTAEPLDSDFQVELSLVDGKGGTGQAQRFDLSPVWPTGEWPANAIVRERYRLVIDKWLDGGQYGVVLDLVQDGQAVGQRVTLGEVEMMLPERSFAVPDMAQEVGAVFGDDLRLLGYGLEAGTDSLHITLHWQALQRMDTSYTMFVHVFDPTTGDIVAQADVVPYGFTYPTAWWEAAEVVSDEIVISLEEAPEGRYGWAVGVYDADTGDRLVISGQPSDLVVEGDRLVLPEQISR